MLKNFLNIFFVKKINEFYKKFYFTKKELLSEFSFRRTYLVKKMIKNHSGKYVID